MKLFKSKTSQERGLYMYCLDKILNKEGYAHTEEILNITEMLCKNPGVRHKASGLNSVYLTVRDEFISRKVFNRAIRLGILVGVAFATLTWFFFKDPFTTKMVTTTVFGTVSTLVSTSLRYRHLIWHYEKGIPNDIHNALRMHSRDISIDDC